jgi:hypothetical protein
MSLSARIRATDADNWLREDKMNAAAATPTTRQIYRVALASIVGSVIEQYDFLVTGVIAATVWGGIFFKLPALAAVAEAIGVTASASSSARSAPSFSAISPIGGDGATPWSTR